VKRQKLLPLALPLQVHPNPNAADEVPSASTAAAREFLIITITP
jgi:hypothetical protein